MCFKNWKKGKGLCPVSFGLALGLVFGLCLLITAWAAWLGGVGTASVEHKAMFLTGYSASFVGGIIGGLWGLLKGFLLGFFIALFYDWISCCCKSSCCKCDGVCQCDSKGDKSGSGK